MMRRYFVIFAQRVGPRPWWDRWSAPGFRHCFVMWQPIDVGFKPIIAIEPLQWTIAPSFQFGILIEEAVARLLLDDHVTVALEVDVDMDGRVPYFPIGPRSCVNVVKACLGIHAWRVQTPRQLYKHLLYRHDAKMWHRQQLTELADG